MAKQLLYSDQARAAILSGVNQLANAVKATLGPKGRNAILDKKFGAPTITKDGVTVAKEIELHDPYQNMGAQLVKEVASKTSDVAGDGTTTATVLAQAIYREGVRHLGLHTRSECLQQQFPGRLRICHRQGISEHRCGRKHCDHLPPVDGFQVTIPHRQCRYRILRGRDRFDERAHRHRTAAEGTGNHQRHVVFVDHRYRVPRT